MNDTRSGTLEEVLPLRLARLHQGREHYDFQVSPVSESLFVLSRNTIPSPPRVEGPSRLRVLLFTSYSSPTVSVDVHGSGPFLSYTGYPRTRRSPSCVSLGTVAPPTAPLVRVLLSLLGDLLGPRHSPPGISGVTWSEMGQGPSTYTQVGP